MTPADHPPGADRCALTGGRGRVLRVGDSRIPLDRVLECRARA